MSKHDKPRIGRPVKVPTEEQLNSLNLLTLVMPEARKLLRKCEAPESWGEKELRLLLTFVAVPDDFDAVSLRKFTNKVLNEHRAANALNFGKMFAEAPNTIIEALPEIRTLLDKSRGIPRSQKKRTRNVLAAVVENYVWEHTFDNHFRLKDSKQFWTEKSALLAFEFSKRLNLPVTERTIENARVVINGLFPPVSKKI